MKSINCPECGYLIQDNSTFCKMCGCRIDKKSETADEDSFPQPEQHSGIEVQAVQPSDSKPPFAKPFAPVLPAGQNPPANSAAPKQHATLPGPVPGPVPGNYPGAYIGTNPGQYSANGAVPSYPSSNVAPPYRVNPPVNYPAQNQGTFPGNVPGNVPRNVPGNYPGNFPGNYPGQYAPSGRSAAYKPMRNKTNASGKKLWIILLSVIGGIVLLIGISIITVSLVSPGIKYNSACEALQNQQFDKAYDDFIALGSYKDSKTKAIESLYKKGVYLNKNKKYKEAAEIFKSLNAYEDSRDQYQSAYYNYGLQLMGEGAYSDAINVFTSLGDYEDSETMVNEAKYCYIVNHLDNSDITTYNYLNELIAIKYKDCKQLYKSLYAWKATTFYFNTGSDATDKKTSISRSSPLYCHFTIEGGPPQGSFYAYASAIWPDGSKMTKKKSDVIMSGNKTYWWGWKDGIYLDPKNGKTGTFTLILYDENNNEIGRSSIPITK